MELECLLPHRGVMRLVSDVRIEGDRAIGKLTVTADHPFLAGHFPGLPVWPGMLLAEAMAQVAAVLMLTRCELQGPDHVPVLGAVDVRFLAPIFPPASVDLRASCERVLDGSAIFAVAASDAAQRRLARGRVVAAIVHVARLRRQEGDHARR